jgi:hypothetical protein
MDESVVQVVHLYYLWTKHATTAERRMVVVEVVDPHCVSSVLLVYLLVYLLIYLLVYLLVYLLIFHLVVPSSTIHVTVAREQPFEYLSVMDFE